jgi:hypothetical protein
MEPARIADWNRSHEWVVERTFHHRRRVSIRFAGGKPSLAEFAAVRRCFQEFAQMPPKLSLAQLDESGELDIGSFSIPDAAKVVEKAQTAGLDVVVRDASYVGSIAIDRTQSSAPLIEDEEESAATIKAMIEAGVPVHDIEEG